MLAINIAIINPGGNTTALLLDPAEGFGDKKLIQNQIIKLNSEVEQCGVLTTKEGSYELQMFGGELCLNALRCAFYYLLVELKLKKVLIHCCGREYCGNWFNNSLGISFDLPIVKDTIKEVDKKYIIDLIDIVHIVSFELPNTKLDFESTCKTLISKFKLDNRSAVGCSFYIEGQPARFGVWVKSIDSFFDETACGSGSISIALAVFHRSDETNLKITQPSGSEFQTMVDPFVDFHMSLCGPIISMQTKIINL
jgi:histidine racemase